MWHIVSLIQESININFVSLYMVDSNKEFAVMKAGTGKAGQKLLEMGCKFYCMVDLIRKLWRRAQ